MNRRSTVTPGRGATRTVRRSVLPACLVDCIFTGTMDGFLMVGVVSKTDGSRIVCSSMKDALSARDLSCGRKYQDRFCNAACGELTCSL
jgi:hypothetical protein